MRVTLAFGHGPLTPFAAVRQLLPHLTPEQRQSLKMTSPADVAYPVEIEMHGPGEDPVPSERAKFQSVV